MSTPDRPCPGVLDAMLQVAAAALVVLLVVSVCAASCEHGRRAGACKERCLPNVGDLRSDVCECDLTRTVAGEAP